MTQNLSAKDTIGNTEKLDAGLKKKLEQIALVIRGLSIDAVQKADSGHPGLPLGCAEIGAYLYGYSLNQNPNDPKWINRDRFILSAGHGSMLLYSCLYLSGYHVSLEDLKSFRQLHSNTPGHPESHLTEGVETTTGPLGQGVGNAVGQALGLKIMQANFNTSSNSIFNQKVFCLMGDGCMMEGISSEVSSFAGHLGLDNLILIYDSNHVSLDGPLSDSASEDTKKRYEAYGWDTYEIDGHNLVEIHETITKIRKSQKKPSLIIAHTIIGKGSPHKAGTSKVHGSPLGEEELKLTKEALGIPLEPFYVSEEVKDYFKERRKKQEENEKEWESKFENWAKENPELFQKLERQKRTYIPEDIEKKLTDLVITDPISGRKASHIVLQTLAELVPSLIGGSADLSCSDLTMLEKYPIITKGNFSGRNIKFGVREFGMATIATGLTQMRLFTAYIGTFLTFSDYMRNAIRLASLQEAHVIYQFTHDSIFLGEDGPTHQPVEHYMSLRAIINLQVIRPGSAHEVKMAWIAALRYKGPTAILLSRQNIREVKETHVPYSEGVGRGAYLVKKEKSKPDFTFFATGSELPLAMDVANELERMGKQVRVISMPCWEIYEQQEKDYKEEIMGGDLGKRVSIEAGVDQGWYKYIGREGIAICMKTYGMSAPYKDLQKEFGFTKESIIDRIV